VQQVSQQFKLNSGIAHLDSTNSSNLDAYAHPFPLKSSSSTVNLIVRSPRQESGQTVAVGASVTTIVGAPVVGAGVITKGADDGAGEGLIDHVGSPVGVSLGILLGVRLGESLGSLDGASLGTLLGVRLGESLGILDGTSLGMSEGILDGIPLG